MNHLLTLLKQDIKFQFRHGFYLVYGIITIIYIGILLLSGEVISNTLSPLILFSDPTFIGFFFIGAILFFEREQMVTEALFVTPVRIEAYIISKCLSLTLVSLMVVVLITVFIHGIHVNWFYLIFGISSTSIIFILIGMFFSHIFRSITVYLVLGGLMVAPFSIPILYILGFSSSWLFYLIPTTSSLKLIFGAINGGLSYFDSIYSIGYLSLTIAILFLLVRGIEGGQNEGK